MVDSTTVPAGVFARATLNFAARSGEFVGEAVDVDIVDARTVDLPDWQQCGFGLIEHTSAATSWDDDELAAVHHREMEELAREMTGCDVALVSNHIKRGPEHAER